MKNVYFLVKNKLFFDLMRFRRNELCFLVIKSVFEREKSSSIISMFLTSKNTSQTMREDCGNEFFSCDIWRQCVRERYGKRYFLRFTDVWLGLQTAMFLSLPILHWQVNNEACFASSLGHSNRSPVVGYVML